MEMKLELQELAYVGQLGTEGTGADKDKDDYLVVSSESEQNSETSEESANDSG